MNNVIKEIDLRKYLFISNFCHFIVVEDFVEMAAVSRASDERLGLCIVGIITVHFLKMRVFQHNFVQ